MHGRVGAMLRRRGGVRVTVVHRTLVIAVGAAEGWAGRSERSEPLLLGGRKALRKVARSCAVIEELWALMGTLILMSSALLFTSSLVCVGGHSRIASWGCGSVNTGRKCTMGRTRGLRQRRAGGCCHCRQCSIVSLADTMAHTDFGFGGRCGD